MVGSGGDGQEGQTRLGAEQLPAAMLVLELEGHKVMYRGNKLYIAVVEVMDQLRLDM